MHLKLIVPALVAVALAALAARWHHTASIADGVVLMTPLELAAFNGSSGGPLYLALLGDVFDVSEGTRFYGPGGAYSGFVAKDASAAFLSGNFTPEGLHDDVSGLTPDELKSLVDWRSFYHMQYRHVGWLVGRFYSDTGLPTTALLAVEEGAQAAQVAAEAAAVAKDNPAYGTDCNVRWSAARGSTVWCDGGAHPRRLMVQAPDGTSTARCGCFEEAGWSDLRQLYQECAPDATECQAAPPT